MRRHLFILLAAWGLLGCTETMTDTGSPEKGELERSYLSVTLKSGDTSTRAEGADDFEYGDADERYVENAHFFLFKADGTAFPVRASGGKNYLSIALSKDDVTTEEDKDTDEVPNVSDVKDQILVFDSYKGQYPAYIVAVLNWDAKHIQPSYTLDNLYNSLASIRNANNHFVMSNTVYADLQGKMINATPLTPDHIGKSEAEAMAHPIEIYVERISAKVEVTAKGDVADMEATYDVKTSLGETPIYAKVLNWELHNEYHQSIVLKHIYPDRWGTAGDIGFLWNDPNHFRSYWAASYTGSFPADNRFGWAEGLSPGDVTYCGENTRQAVLDDEGTITADPRTKVIVKAQLVKADGTPIEVAIWHGHRYLSEQGVREQIASLLSSQLFYREGEEYKSIGQADLKAVAGNAAPEGVDVEAYEVFFQLADESLTKGWHTYSSAEGYEAATSDDINARLAEVEPALYYKDGMTYYYTPIRHLGSVGSASEYGVVRNHIYKVNISEISGLGTPVSDPDIGFDTPQRPVDTSSYVAAEVRILAWKVVKNNYNI